LKPDAEIRAERRRAADNLIISSSLLVIAAILVVATFTYLGPVLMPIIIALMLYYVITPIARFLVRCHIRPWLAYVTLFLAVSVLFTALGQVVYYNARTFQQRFPEYRDRFITRLQGWTGPEASDAVLRSVSEMVDISARDVFRFAFNTAFSSLELALMVFFYLLFIIINGARVGGRVERAFRAETAGRLLTIGNTISESIQQYVKVKTLVSLGLGATTGLILYACRIEYWPLWTFTMFVLNYVTYIGSIIALLPPVALAFLQFDSELAAAGLAVALIVNRLVWIDYVEIRYSGTNLNIDPVLLLAAIAYWGWFWGAVGLVLAVPMMTCLKIALLHFDRGRPWAILMSDR
jgi:predicted PurR-regulated permease PerM